MMKKILSFLLLCALVFGMLPTLPMAASAEAGDVELVEENFPDANFLKYLKEKFDTTANGGTAGDGILTAAEIGKITEIDCRSPKIKSLEGIEHFTALTDLLCENIQLTKLDVSKNTALTVLWCGWNQLTSLDVSKNTALTNLDCSGNKLSELDVSQNTALTKLSCGGNQLTSLDVSKNTALTDLECYGNKLSELDVSKNTALKFLSCGGNQLTSLDVSKNTALKSLYCDENKLSELDVSKNTALTALECNDNQLTNLDVSKNTALEYLYCYENKLSELDLSKNKKLWYLDIGDDGVKKYDLSQNLALRELIIHKKMDLTEQADGTWQVDLNKLKDIATLPDGWIDISKIDETMIYTTYIEAYKFRYYDISIPNAKYNPTTGIVTAQNKNELLGDNIFVIQFENKVLGLTLYEIPYGGATPAPIPTPNPPPPPISGGDPTPVTYTIIEGANSVWTAGNPDVVIVFDIPYDKFEDLMIGGKIVDPSNYSIKGDSTTTVTISAKYLKTLKLREEKYEVKVVAVDGEAKGVLKIDGPGDDTEVPLYILLFATSAFIVMTGTAITKKYNGTF